MKTQRSVRHRALRHALAIGLWAFLIAMVSSVASQTGVEHIKIFAVGVLLLLVVILIGVVFDIIGVAAAVAKEGPLHAMAANQVFGARHAVRLVRSAPKVASFCNDVIGDVSGTLSGAIGVTLIHNLMQSPSDRQLVFGVTFMTACIAALVVGGKAYGKIMAIEQGTQIMFRVGQLVALLDRILPFELVPDRKHRRSSTAGRSVHK